MKHIAVLCLVCLLAAALSACGGISSVSAQPDPADTLVEIRVFTNLPDRTSDQGLIEQMIFNDYMAQNPHIRISVEALDDEAYKIKFRAYAAGTDMPDLVSVWGQPGFIAEIIEAGLLAELTEDDYGDYGFIEGSLDGFRGADGKLYGLPRNTDVMGIYYNKAIFDRYMWAIPSTFEELLALCDKARAEGLEPIAIDGADKWPLALFYHDMMTKYFGQNLASLYTDSISGKDFHSSPIFLDLARLFQESVPTLFQKGFETHDHGTCQNMFVSGKSAMYYIGSWQMSMASDASVSPNMRENIRVFAMPLFEGGTGTATDIAAWNGGGHSVTASGKQKEEAIKLLGFMYRPENWSRLAWVNNVCMSAQDFARYITGDETQVQLEFIDIVQTATSISGTPLNDSGTAQFKANSESLVQELAASMITPEQFIAELDR